MKLIDKTIEGDLIGVPLLTFNDGLTKQAIVDIGTKIEYIEPFLDVIEKMVSDNDIESIVTNIGELKKLFNDYKQNIYIRKRK